MSTTEALALSAIRDGFAAYARTCRCPVDRKPGDIAELARRLDSLAGVVSFGMAEVAIAAHGIAWAIDPIEVEGGTIDLFSDTLTGPAEKEAEREKEAAA